jgi:hypothetical protein
MLEQSSLLLRPWTPAPAGLTGGRARLLLDAAGQPAGVVREPTFHGARWLRWLRPRSLEVCELPDSSLVFALRRGWGWPGGWQLVDADERLVGTLHGRAMLDGFGHFLAALEPPDQRGRGRFLALEGRELGEYVLEREGTRVTFETALEGNPFAKMLLLGVVLVREE